MSQNTLTPSTHILSYYPKKKWGHSPPTSTFAGTLTKLIIKVTSVVYLRSFNKSASKLQNSAFFKLNAVILENKNEWPSQAWMIDCALVHIKKINLFSLKQNILEVQMTVKLIQYTIPLHWVQLRWVTEPSTLAFLRKEAIFYTGTASRQKVK